MSDTAKGRLDPLALKIAATKLRKLRLSMVGGRKEHSAATVASAMKKALGGIYEPCAIDFILSHGIAYYLDAIVKPSPPPNAETDQ